MPNENVLNQDEWEPLFPKEKLMNFTQSEQVSPSPNTAGVASCHAPLPLLHRPWPPWPLRAPGRPGPCTQGSTGSQSASTPHAPPDPDSPQHIPTFYLKSKATHPLPDSPLFLWRTLPYTLLPDDEHCVLCVLLRSLFNSSLLPVLVTHLPHACF